MLGPIIEDLAQEVFGNSGMQMTITKDDPFSSEIKERRDGWMNLCVHYSKRLAS